MKDIQVIKEYVAYGRVDPEEILSDIKYTTAVEVTNDEIATINTILETASMYPAVYVVSTRNGAVVAGYPSEEVAEMDFSALKTKHDLTEIKISRGYDAKRRLRELEAYLYYSSMYIPA